MLLGFKYLKIPYDVFSAADKWIMSEHFEIDWKHYSKIWFRCYIT